MNSHVSNHCHGKCSCSKPHVVFHPTGVNHHHLMHGDEPRAIDRDLRIEEHVPGSENAVQLATMRWRSLGADPKAETTTRASGTITMPKSATVTAAKAEVLSRGRTIVMGDGRWFCLLRSLPLDLGSGCGRAHLTALDCTPSY